MRRIVFLEFILFILLLLKTDVYGNETWKNFYFESQDFSKRGEYLDAYKSAKQSVSASKNIFSNGENTNYALCLCNLGGICLLLGKLDEAQKNYEEAEKIYRKVNGDDDTTIGTIYSSLGNVFLHKNEYSKSIEISLRAINLFKKKNGDEDVIVDGMTKTYMNLGYAYEALGDFSNAKEMYLNALKEHNLNLVVDDEVKADMLNQISNTCYRLNDFTKAIKYAEDSINIYKKKGRYDAMFAIYINLATNYYSMEKYTKAEKVLSRAISMYEKENLNNEDNYSEALMVLAEAYGGTNNIRKMVFNCDEALKVKARILGPTDSRWLPFLDTAKEIYKRSDDALKTRQIENKIADVKKANNL